MDCPGRGALRSPGWGTKIPQAAKHSKKQFFKWLKILKTYNSIGNKYKMLQEKIQQKVGPKLKNMKFFCEKLNKI